MVKKLTRWPSPLWLSVLSIVMFGTARHAYAHGASMSYQTTEVIEIQGKYDSGEPMADAQVAVYAPDDPSTPWLTGTADDQGVFMFKPDLSQPGNWEVQFRLAGHGDIMTIPVDAESNPVGTRGSTGGLNSVQKLIVFGAMTWGFVGTALYFSGRKQRMQKSADSGLQSTTSQF